jgi:excisionase family DNA binding protein
VTTASNNTNGDNPMAKVLLTPEEVAEAVGIGHTKVYELMVSGRLRSVKIGRLRRVVVSALDEFIASLESGAA